MVFIFIQTYLFLRNRKKPIKKITLKSIHKKSLRMKSNYQSNVEEMLVYNYFL